MLSHHLAPPQIIQWSTEDVPPSQRFDYFENALTTAIVPLGVTAKNPRSFKSLMTMLELGDVALLRQTGSPHRSFRASSELSRSGEHTFHFIINLMSSWTLKHCGETRLGPGDAVLIDSHFPADLELASSYECVHVKLSESWVQRWLPIPGALVGKRIPMNSSWGRALTSYATQLSPQSVVGSPLPPRMLIDQLGALLALVAGELAGSTKCANGPAAAFRQQIQDCVEQRCAETWLTAADVASTMNTEERVIHEVLGAFGHTFGELLMATRTNVSVRMLTSPSFRSLSVAEISTRAGFGHTSGLATALKRFHGCTALLMRRGDGSISH